MKKLQKRNYRLNDKAYGKRQIMAPWCAMMCLFLHLANCRQQLRAAGAVKTLKAMVGMV